jgi:hypothetical protein
VGLLAFAFQSPVLADSLTVTQSINVTLSPNGKLTVPSSITLLNGALAFSAFTAALPVLFRARTSESGVGSITVQATSDFSPAGGPSVNTGILTYTCAAALYGTACSGTQTIDTTSQRPVVNLPSNACTGGGRGCSPSDPASIDLQFRLENDVSIPTGTYSVQLTFTVSCT